MQHVNPINLFDNLRLNYSNYPINGSQIRIMVEMDSIKTWQHVGIIRNVSRRACWCCWRLKPRDPDLEFFGAINGINACGHTCSPKCCC